MKLFGKPFVVMMLFSFAVISCEQESELATIDRVDALANATVLSAKFKDLDISLSELNVGESRYVNAEMKSIFIPFYGHDDRKGLISIFDENERLITVSAYESLTDIPADLIYVELKSGNFSGTFVFKTELGEVQVSMERSKILDTKVLNVNRNGRTAACGPMSEPGGALDCAGARLENMNWFDQALCFGTFIPCMAQMVASCLIDGCAIQ